MNIYDDILVYGLTQADHDKSLRQLLNRLRELGLTGNLDKCIFNVSVIDFYGMRFSEHGMEPDPNKLEAIRVAVPPKTVLDLKSFLGMTNYSSNFIPNYSSKTAKLRELLISGKTWEWNHDHQKCFDELKLALQGSNVLGCFDVNARTKVVVDASPFGLGAMLLQTQKSGHDKVIAYASRSLNSAESNYSQIERECLAIYFSCIRFQMYLLGKEFTIYTDHKPLVSLLNNGKKNSPFRIERMRLKLQGFRYHVVHLPGKLNPSDFPSRHPAPLQKHDDSCISDELKVYVNKVIKELDSPISTLEIQNEYKNDHNISRIIPLLIAGTFPTKKDNFGIFFNIWDELSVTDGLLLRGERIIIPEALHKRIVHLGHEGHLGIMNTKRLLRSKVWFPNLDNMVEEEIRNCHSCQTTVYKHDSEPLVMSILPNGPWEYVKVDFFGPLPSGDYILEVVDEYSRWVEIEILRSTSATSTIPKLDKIFSSYGIMAPHSIVWNLEIFVIT